jgi:hypothetical protein
MGLDVDPQTVKKQVYVHIGFPKTGTTSIQVWLTGNADALAAQGVLYPVAGRGEGDYRFAHHRLPNALAQTPLSELATSWPDMEALHNEIANSTALRVIISSEDFSTKLGQPAIDNLVHWFADFDVRIVCYVRRQDEFIISIWSTAVGQYGEKNPLSACLDHSWLDYAHTLKLWASAFGAEAITLRVFEDSQLVGGDVVGDFLSVCGVDPPKGNVLSGQMRYNQRAPAHIAVIQAYLNAHEGDRSAVVRLNTLKSISDGSRGRFQLMSPADRAALLARHAEGNSLLARTYLGRIDGRLFDDLTIPGDRRLWEWPSGSTRGFSTLELGGADSLAFIRKTFVQLTYLAAMSIRMPSRYAGQPVCQANSTAFIHVADCRTPTTFFAAASPTRFSPTYQSRRIFTG